MEEFDVNAIISQLSPGLRKKVSTGSSIPATEFARTPSYGLNKALAGGFPYGRQCLVWGNKSSGKSSFMMQTIALAQEEGKICAWIDAEMTFSPEWATRLGVDTEKLIVSTARTMNDMVDIGTELMGLGVDLIVVDSISALLPAIYFEKDSGKGGKDPELKQLENTKQIGAEARDMANAVKMLNYANNRVKPTLLIFISQARNKLGDMYPTQIPTGGEAVKFYSSTIVKLFSSASENQAIKEKISTGDKLIEMNTGRKVRWQIENSKTSSAWTEGFYDFYFRGDEVGVDSIGDLVDTAESFGILKRGGAWYTLDDGTKIQGRDAMVARVREDLDLQDALIEGLRNV